MPKPVMTTSTLDPEDHEQAASELRDGSAHFASESHSNVGDRHKARHETQNGWDTEEMKENYEQGGVLKELVERGREDYQTGNTRPLP